MTNQQRSARKHSMNDSNAIEEGGSTENSWNLETSRVKRIHVR